MPPKTKNRPKVKLLDRDEVEAVITGSPINGVRLPDWIKKQQGEVVGAIEATVREGLRRGDTLSELSERVNKTLDVAERHADTLARTAVNQVKNEIDFEQFSQIPELTTKYTFVSVLDNRTTAICRSLDGKEFRYDDPRAPKPPLHFNCRSEIMPVMDFASMGIEGYETPVRKAEGPDGVELLDVPGEKLPFQKTDYEAWLKQQPDDFQDEILGIDKAELFRKNKITLPDLVNRDGRELSLDEVKDFIANKPTFKKFADDLKAQRALDKAFQESIDNLTQAQISQLRDYQGLGHKILNKYLYDPQERTTFSIRAKEELRQTIAKMDEAIELGEVPQNLKLFRGFDHAELASLAKANPEALPGAVLKFDNYLSSSPVQFASRVFANAEEGVILEMKIPKGTKAMFLGHKDITNIRYETEMLLGRGHSFRVEKVDRSGAVVKLIVELIN